MNKKTTATRTRLAVGLLMIISITASGAYADPPSWDSFLPATFQDIYVAPPFETGVLDYTLSLGPAPKLTFGGNSYDMAWVGAFFALSEDRSDFVATNGTVVTDWKWERKTEQQGDGAIAGWISLGNQTRIFPGQSKVFGYSSFDTLGKRMLCGFHIGYLSGDNLVNTAFFRDLTSEESVVPEPSPAAALCILIGLPGLLARIRRT